MRNQWWAKLLRIVAIVLMSLTAVITLMGGAGTTCVALEPNGFGGKFSAIAPFQWLWVLFVLVGVAAGVLGVRAVVLLIRGAKDAYRAALIALLLGATINAIHLFASRALRGASMPVDAVLYANLFTLAVFLLLHLPGVRQGIDFEKPSNDPKTGNYAAAIALAAAGLLVLIIQFPMASTHTIEGVNYADVWHNTLSLLGGVLIASAMLIAFWEARGIRRRHRLVTGAARDEKSAFRA